jgi:hypothetical protein
LKKIFKAYKRLLGIEAPARPSLTLKNLLCK